MFNPKLLIVNRNIIDLGSVLVLMQLIQWLRFFSIVLVVIIMGLAVFLIWFRRSLTYGPREWGWGLTAFLILLFSAIGTPVAMYDSVTYDWGEQTVSIPVSGLVLSGETVSFGVYWDVTATNPVTNIVWGEIEAGSSADIGVWIKNEGPVDLYCQAFWIEDSWDPPGVHVFFTMGWEFGEGPIKSGRARFVPVSLHVDATITGVTDFYFEIEVHGDYIPPS